MFGWLLWGTPTRPKAKQLDCWADKLLAEGDTTGDSAFILPEKELKRLCFASRQALLKQPSLVEITTTSDVVVVGDLHGQYNDLQRMFKQLGRPGSDSKVWVFLGDYIDRGPMGLEIVATLLALKLRHPGSIHLLRGNHECSEITVLFGFCGECQRRSTLEVWEAVMQVFDALPLAALLNGAVFLCHGGISPHLTRPQDVNSIQRPLDVNPNGEGLLSDLLWADPSAHVQGWNPNPRGVSYIFGLDVARQWLRSQGLKAIVRAHMVQQAGFEVLGNNEVMTVFSASDYRETGNTGAVLRIAPSLDFEFVTFPPLRPGAAEEAAAAAASFAALVSSSRPSAEAAPVTLPLPPQPSPFAAAAEAGPAGEAAEGGVGAATAAAAAAAAAAGAVAGVEAGLAAAPPAGPPAEGEALTPAEQAMQQEVAEDYLVVKGVEGDEELGSLMRQGSKGLEELEALAGGCRVPGEVLAQTSPPTAGSPLQRSSPSLLARTSPSAFSSLAVPPPS